MPALTHKNGSVPFCRIPLCNPRPCPNLICQILNHPFAFWQNGIFRHLAKWEDTGKAQTMGFVEFLGVLKARIDGFSRVFKLSCK